MSGEKKIRWGLLGGGAILDRWMKGACQVEDMEIVGIASRSRETAEKMAERYEIPEVMTYEEMVKRDDIDIVYVPVPHTAHKELAMMAMRAGKHVLVEKPAAVNAADFEEMAACAKESGVFMMEAVWTRFFPLIEKIRECIESGKIGKVRTIKASFSFRVGDDYQGRLLDPAQAGGGLLDVGVYPLHFARMILERDPEELIGLAAIGTDHLNLQIDEQAGMIARYDDGTLAMMSCGVRTEMQDTAYIYGTEGSIEIPSFWKPAKMIVTANGQCETIEAPVPQNAAGIEDEGYQFEIRHVNQCLRDGLMQSPLMPHEATRAVLSQCDALRRQWGLKYPVEV